MTQDIEKLIYSSQEGVTAAMKYIERGRENIKNGLGLRFPIKEIADSVPIPPTMPGKVLTFQGKSNQGKSMFLDFWRNDLAQNIERRHREAEKKASKSLRIEDIIISVSAEDMIEEQMVGELLRQAERMNMREQVSDFETLKLISSKIGATPIYYIGQSIERANEDVPNPTMTNVARAIQMIIERRKDAGLKTNVQAVFIDYIQAMPSDNEAMRDMHDRTRRLQVRQDFFGLRRLAAKIPAPCVMASQSKQVLENDYGEFMQLPGLYDHQETSAIPQHTDADFSIWMPKKDLRYGEVVTHKHGSKEIDYRVNDTIAWLRLNKQRGVDIETLKKLPGDFFWPLNINYEKGTYELADIERIAL